MIEDYIPFTHMLVVKYGRRYLPYFSFDELLSYAYEALVNSYRSFNGKGNIKGWILYNVRNSLSDCARDGDWLSTRYRKNVKAGIDPDIEFIDIEESNVCSNGDHIKQFEDRCFIEHLIREAGLTEKEKRRLEMYIYERLTQVEISRVEGVGEAAVSLSHLESIRKLRAVWETL